jgi:hypothetical protein
VTTVFYALNWAVVFILLALWSLGAWAVHAIASWAVTGAGAFAGAVPSPDAVPLPDWLALWLPPEAAMTLGALQSSVLPFVESVLTQMPSLAGGLTALVWMAWALGGVLLLLLGLAGSGLIAVLSRKGTL